MEEAKRKVLFVGDLVVETGFSTVNHNIIKHIEERFEITGLGVNYFGDPHIYPFPIFPALAPGGRGNIYGLDRVCTLLNTFTYDVVFILNDAWVISYYLDAIKKNVTKKLPAIVVYFPVDSECHDPEWYKDFDIVTEAYTYTEFGRRVVNHPDCKPDLKLGIIPHGVASEDFYQIYPERFLSKPELFGDKLKGVENPEDTFIVLNANRNQPRKKLDVTMAGFSMFAEGKPNNVKLYMHCGIVDSSINVIKQAKRYRIDDRLIFTNLAQGVQRVQKAKLNQIFNACDVGINTGLGEGWGLTHIEHAVTGAVQVVPRHSACEELFSDCGLLMEVVTNITFDQSETVGKLTTPEEVARNLELLYSNRDLRTRLSEKCKAKFSSPEYNWKNIAQTWGDIFERVSEEK